jgi:hypothetical protein
MVAALSGIQACEQLSAQHHPSSLDSGTDWRKQWRKASADSSADREPAAQTAPTRFAELVRGPMALV